jgi:prepilin peptidase CpaA
MNPTEVVPLALLACILAFSAFSDARQLRIPNLHVVAVIGLFALAASFSLSWPDLAERLIAAGITFGIGFVLFALRLFGGGDVKMMSAMMLYIPASHLALYLFVFSCALLVSSLAITVLNHARSESLQNWEGFQTRGHIPVGVALFLSIIGVIVLGRA